METEQRVAAAKEVLRHLLGRMSHRHRRIHTDTALDNVNRLRALEGLCGACTHVQLTFKHKDGKDLADVGCIAEHNPIVLYENTFGETASCPGFDKRVGK